MSVPSTYGFVLYTVILVIFFIISLIFQHCWIIISNSFKGISFFAIFVSTISAKPVIIARGCLISCAAAPASSIAALSLLCSISLSISLAILLDRDHATPEKCEYQGKPQGVFYLHFYFPNGQMGYLHSLQFIQRPPCPSSASSFLPILSPARTLGNIKSNTVVL